MPFLFCVLTNPFLGLHQATITNIASIPTYFVISVLFTCDTRTLYIVWYQNFIHPYTTSLSFMKVSKFCILCHHPVYRAPKPFILNHDLCPVFPSTFQSSFTLISRCCYFLSREDSQEYSWKYSKPKKAFSFRLVCSLKRSFTLFAQCQEPVKEFCDSKPRCHFYQDTRHNTAAHNEILLFVCNVAVHFTNLM